MLKSAVELDKNYFELFDLAPTFSISLESLAATFKVLQSQVHPDRFANAPDAEKRLSVQHSSYINQAYQTLRNPLQRAKYLLQLHGAKHRDENHVQSHTIRDPQFLMQQMELRESLEHVASEPDPLTALLRMDDDISNQINVLYKELESCFKPGEVSPDALSGAEEIVNRLQFLLKLQSEISDKQQQLF